jgi:hypothetical protein
VCRVISFSDFGKYSCVDAGSYGIAQKCFQYFISKTQRVGACADRRIVGMDGLRTREFTVRKFQAVDVFLEASSL